MNVIIFALLLGVAILSVSASPVSIEKAAKFLFFKDISDETERYGVCATCPSTKTTLDLAQAACESRCSRRLNCVVVNTGDGTDTGCFRCLPNLTRPLPMDGPGNGTIIIQPSIAAVPTPSGPAATVTPSPMDIVFASVFPAP